MRTTRQYSKWIHSDIAILIRYTQKSDPSARHDAAKVLGRKIKQCLNKARDIGHPFPRLTNPVRKAKRDGEILQMAHEGYCTKDIARKFNVNIAVVQYVASKAKIKLKRKKWATPKLPPSRPKNSWTPEQKERFDYLWNVEGVSAEKIADDLNMTPCAIRSARQRFKFSKRLGAIKRKEHEEGHTDCPTRSIPLPMCSEPLHSGD